MDSNTILICECYNVHEVTLKFHDVKSFSAPRADEFLEDLGVDEFLNIIQNMKFDGNTHLYSEQKADTPTDY